MPYGRGRRMRRGARRMGRRKRGGFGIGSAIGLARAAYRGYRYIRGLVNVEKKFYDVTGSGTVTTTPGVAALTGMAQGTDYNQREGLSVKTKSLYLQGNITCNPNIAGSYGQTVRVVIVIDKDNQGSNPGWGDVFESSSIISAVNHTNGKRFQILMDHNFKVAPGSTDGVINFKRFIRCSQHLKWSSTTGTSFREGHMFLLLLSDTANVNNVPTINYYSRLRYVDN